MKVFVVGGAGYIGSHVVHELIDSNHEVTILDNLSLGLKENIHPGAQFIEGDMRNELDLEAAIDSSFDIVFHLGALKAAGDSMINPEVYAQNNINGSINLLNAMSKSNVKKIVFSSSAAVYGEPEYLPIDEKHKVQPFNFYGYTKASIEDTIDWYSKLKQFNYAFLRYFNATGYDVKGRIMGKERGTNNLSPIVMEVLAGMRDKLTIFGKDYETPDGTCLRDYIHVNDLATAHLKSMNYILEKKQNLTVNLGTGKSYSVLDLISATEKVSGKKVAYEIGARRYGDTANLVADSSLAYELLQWKPKYVDIEEIMNSMLPVYLS